MIAGALVIVRGEHETRSLCFPFQLPNVDEINHGALRQSLGMALEIPARLVSAQSGEVRLLSRSWDDGSVEGGRMQIHIKGSKVDVTWGLPNETNAFQDYF
jgi:hypothetical protein